MYSSEVALNKASCPMSPASTIFSGFLHTFSANPHLNDPQTLISTSNLNLCCQEGLVLLLAFRRLLFLAFLLVAFPALAKHCTKDFKIVSNFRLIFFASIGVNFACFQGSVTCGTARAGTQVGIPMHMYPGTGTRVCTAAQACRGFGRVPWRVPGYPVGTYPTGGTQTRLPPKVRFAQLVIF